MLVLFRLFDKADTCRGLLALLAGNNYYYVVRLNKHFQSKPTVFVQINSG
jgi:hypothetical protein